MQKITLTEINAYYDGIREGVYMYAHMKDGTYYVGTTGRTLKEAYVEIENERIRVMEKHGYSPLPHTAEN
jgi:hypothetical protein